jgi:hypothetical protein
MSICKVLFLLFRGLFVSRSNLAVSSISWLVCQPKQFDLGESGSSSATDCSATNDQTSVTQEQGQDILVLALSDMA